jgi:hypothetical protein
MDRRLSRQVLDHQDVDIGWINAVAQRRWSRTHSSKRHDGCEDSKGDGLKKSAEHIPLQEVPPREGSPANGALLGASGYMIQHLPHGAQEMENSFCLPTQASPRCHLDIPSCMQKQHRLAPARMLFICAMDCSTAHMTSKLMYVEDTLTEAASKACSSTFATAGVHQCIKFSFEDYYATLLKNRSEACL